MHKFLSFFQEIRLYPLPPHEIFPGKPQKMRFTIWLFYIIIVKPIGMCIIQLTIDNVQLTIKVSLRDLLK